MTLVTSSLPLIPLRNEPFHRSEQVSQLLFGEKAYIVESSDNWVKIKMVNDNYFGWIEKYSLTPAKENYINSKACILTLPLVQVQTGDVILHLPAGSELQINKDSGTIYIGENELKFETHSGNTIFKPCKTPVETALRFLNAPYQWGGRTILGMDCSGLTQLVYKLHGVNIARDASEQAKDGIAVEFIQKAIAGDLLFFDNAEGNITHVGIYMGNQQIIHCSISVRIDRVDQQGIFNEERKTYTHPLRLIKRFSF